MSASIDALERRQLLATHGRFDASKGVLRLFGTPGDDNVEIQVKLGASPTDSNGDSYLLGISINGSDGNAAAFNYHRGELRTLRLYLGDGDDTVGFRFNLPGNDAFAAQMIIDAGAGNDTIVAGDGNDRIDGGSGSDDIRAGRGNDTVYAGAGNDRVRTQGGNDTVYGGSGDDRFFSDATGTTQILGQTGNDTLVSGASRDTFQGGAGTDLIDYSARAEALFIGLDYNDQVGETIDSRLGNNQPRVRNNGLYDDGRASATEGDVKASVLPFSDDRFYGIGAKEYDQPIDVEEANGGSGDDIIVGSSRANILHGGAGDDTIYAGGGTDNVYGDAGNDWFFTVDTRDGQPTTTIGRNKFADLIDGGGGKDFARVDLRDLTSLRTSIEKLETLPPLTV